MTNKLIHPYNEGVMGDALKLLGDANRNQTKSWASRRSLKQFISKTRIVDTIANKEQVTETKQNVEQEHT